MHAKSVKKIALVMEEALREETRSILMRASSWSMSFDDKAEWRLCNFDASLVEADPTTGKTRATRKQGVLGVQNLFPEERQQWSECDKDYATKVADGCQRVLREVCGEDRIFEMVSKSLTGLMADGAPAMQRGLRYLQSVFPNVCLIGRDTAHIIRKTACEAWVRELNFEDLWKDLWSSKESLIPSIQNSEVLKTELAACQRVVVKVDGAQSCGLGRILKHFSFAKQRYESHAGPQHVYCLLMTSVILLLARQIADHTVQPTRRACCRALLQKFTPHHAGLAGLSADWN